MGHLKYLHRISSYFSLLWRSQWDVTRYITNIPQYPLLYSYNKEIPNYGKKDPQKSIEPKRVCQLLGVQKLSEVWCGGGKIVMDYHVLYVGLRVLETVM